MKFDTIEQLFEFAPPKPSVEQRIYLEKFSAVCLQYRDVNMVKTVRHIGLVNVTVENTQS